MNPNRKETRKEVHSVKLDTISGLPMPPAEAPQVKPDALRQPAVTKAATTVTPLAHNVEKPDKMGPGSALPLWFKDIAGLVVFIIVVVLGAWLINSFIFRSFNVVGPSMEPTLEGEGSSDLLIVNRVAVTAAQISGKQYVPERGNIIVFKNPTHGTEEGIGADEYIVKRVIGLPGERVTVNDCTLKVYNSDHPDGFDPYPDFKTLAANDKDINNCVEGGGTDATVPDGQVFVVGDHRVGNYSMDSRNGGNRASLGTVPVENIVGPVALRIWPLDKLKAF